jgi:hypothetical protein
MAAWLHGCMAAWLQQSDGAGEFPAEHTGDIIDVGGWSCATAVSLL